MARINKTATGANAKLGSANSRKKKTAQGNSKNTKFKNKNKRRVKGA